MLSALRLFFLGATPEARKRVYYLVRIRPSVYSLSDLNVMHKSFRNYTATKVAGAALGVACTYFTPPDLAYPLAVDVAVLFGVYRAVRTFAWLKLENDTKFLTEKYEKLRPEEIASTGEYVKEINKSYENLLKGKSEANK